MHSTDKQLRSLLADDEASRDTVHIASHVERCQHCQARLEKLTGAGKWTTELVHQLRQQDLDSLDVESDEPWTVIENLASDVLAADVEIDAISLDFLGPPQPKPAPSATEDRSENRTDDQSNAQLGDQPSGKPYLGKLGRYDVERVIGAGGMGLVLKGFDAELHRAVAIKVLAPHLAHSAAARKRFAREAQATAAVIHPHVIPIHNVETGDRPPYLVMSYINGPSLQSHVDDHGPLPIDEVLRIGQQTAAGLAAAHAQGLVHRDVKPANILLEEGAMRVVLSDFGLARTVDDASLTRTGIVAGTPHYMSPEQAGGDAVDFRSDLFSLGCVLWFMLTGRPPFRAATAMGVLNRICHETHANVREINGQVPVALAKIIDRLLSKKADQRYPSAQAVETDLMSVLQSLKSGQLKHSWFKHGPFKHGQLLSVKRWPMARKSRVGQVGFAAAVVLCLAIGLPRVWQHFAQAGRVSQATGPARLPPMNYSALASPEPTFQLQKTLLSDPWYQSLSELDDELTKLNDPVEQDAMRHWLREIYQAADADMNLLEIEASVLNRELKADTLSLPPPL
ncbi:MAG: serine/threonine protein kinase [Pirellulaceae bacterium]|nr:serine/threonine protein kinase [Pirellulaceae bacterium]